MYYYGGYSGGYGTSGCGCGGTQSYAYLHTDMAVMDMVTMVMEIVPLLY